MTTYKYLTFEEYIDNIQIENSNLIHVIKVIIINDLNLKDLVKEEKNRVFKRKFQKLAECFENDIWFINKEDQTVLNILSENPETIKGIFHYFDLNE